MTVNLYIALMISCVVSCWSIDSRDDHTTMIQSVLAMEMSMMDFEWVFVMSLIGVQIEFSRR